MKKQSIKQLAAMNMHYARYSLDYFFDSIARLGFDRFELWGGAPHFFYPTEAGPSVAEIKKELLRRGLEVVCVTPEQCIYPYNIASSQKEFRKVSAEYFCGWIRRTAELGVTKMLCGAGWGLHDVPIEEAWKYSVESLEKMTREAERCGVTLAFEILLPNESNLVNDMASAKKIMAEIDSPHFGLCIDTVPMFKEGKSLEDYYEALGERIVHIHLNDGKPTGHLTWGDGEQPLEEHLATLARHDYTGDLSLELGADRYYADPEPHLEQGLRVLEKAFGETLK
ncbi:MAG: sugar phosphate isomerase/epimerase [Oscillospiraceae bacterium]|nr:sugar phosphate isomerase/epimerase [Oscillospiraceae bacterium]